MQDLITQGVDGIAVAPSNAPAMARALRAAQEAGIPVMTWDSDLLPEDAALRSTYVGTKNYDIGVNLAKLVQARHPDGGTVCLHLHRRLTQWNDNSYRQAIEPYAAELASGELTVVVADTLPMQMAQLQEGLSNGQVGQRPYEMGYQAMHIL